MPVPVYTLAHSLTYSYILVHTHASFVAKVDVQPRLIFSSKCTASS